ncbi:MAG: PEP-CTERM sorting domain-containing protein [Candidatus Spyradenecus sp.]
MKKLLLFAFAALAVSAAQAVSLTWTANLNLGATVTNGSVAVLIVKGNASEALSLVKGWKLATNSSYITELRVCNADGSTGDSISNPKRYVFSKQGANLGVLAVESVSNGVISRSLPFDSTSFASGGSPATLSLVFFNMTGITTAMNMNSNATEGFYNNDANAVAAVEFASSIFSNGAGSYQNATLDAGSVNIAPEPTVLALLALGVAGVALRRRA